MAFYSEQSVIAHGYLLTAVGQKYGGGGAYLVLADKHDDAFKDRTEFNAHEFDCGSIRNCFVTADAAAERLEKFKSGEFVINPHRKIDPANISIEHMVLDVHAVTFSDEEHEILPVIGALDALKYHEKSLVTSAFPELQGLKIITPPEPAWHTHDGRCPRIQSTVYRHIPASVHDAFNKLAGTNSHTPTDVLEQLKHSAVFYSGLHAIAEEVGKAHLGIDYKVQTSIHLSRVYSYNHTFTPAPPPPPRDIRKEALAMLSQHPPIIGETLIQAAMIRRRMQGPS
ncbi:MAG: hypothetical protein KGQ41_05405 [Alphaproteobacteria bacterium]|nr:hypothetical protein [Alphaproteobacteria bacterium]